MRNIAAILILVLCLMFTTACIEKGETQTPIPSRESKIPSDAVKMGPDNDPHPPILHAQGWEEPVPAPGPINTAGGEDAPFITADGGSIFFFFTPDLSVPEEEQLLDGVTGIYQSRWDGDTWGEPERLILNDDIALDGCPFAMGDRLWFCSARAGFQGFQWFTAAYSGGNWKNWQEAGFDPAYDVGELHITADGEELYYHSDRTGSRGLNDIWVSRKTSDGWGEPENVAAVNTPENESRPFITADGQALWFTRQYKGTPAIFRSARQAGGWGKPELILSQFAGEPTLNPSGDIYFVHHYFKEGEMIEVDIYVAYKK
ncbi:MAG: PD40 domain-containing protein [Anaerolineales bacterium]|nr:PD40 domain-containing protein [Anaerolineales bacterium]